MSSMEYCMFAVDDNPYCAWDWDLAEYNLEFIESIDPGYFRYLADHHAQALESAEHQQHAALSLRTAYSHALETLFAFLFAALQAPDCVVGWLLKYRQSDLQSLLSKVQQRKRILSKVRIERVTWEAVSAAVLVASLEDKGKEARIKQGFATAWSRFADDFLKDSISQEYNSVKHGFRAKAGGVALSIGREDTPGVPAPQERMQTLAASVFGSSFPVAEKIGEGKPHFSLRRVSRNWKPQNYTDGLHLISLSLDNILSFLKMCGGVDPTTLMFSWPSEEGLFQAPWDSGLGISEMSHRPMFAVNDIQPFTKDEILAVYSTERAPDEQSCGT